MPVAAGEEEDDEGEQDGYDCVAGGHAGLLYPSAWLFSSIRLSVRAYRCPPPVLPAISIPISIPIAVVAIIVERLSLSNASNSHWSSALPQDVVGNHQCYCLLSK